MSLTPESAAYIAALPKMELHVHLEGAIRPETLVELARRNAIQLPVDDGLELRSWLLSLGRNNFFGVLSMMARCLGRGEDFERVAYELGSDMANQHVRYAEIHYNVAFHHLRGVGFDESFGGLLRGSERVRRDFGVDMAWILVVMRAPRLDHVVREHSADYSVSAAIEGMSQGVVAVGLGGEETDGDVATFAGSFQRARVAGLHVVPHAGEFAGPGNVAEALDLLGAERIAHGVRAIERMDLVERLAASRICLDICPTSNIRLGLYPELATHPLAGLRAAGVPVSVSSDDPTAFGVDLNSEICAVANVVGLEDAEDILLGGIRHAFLQPNRRQALEAEFVSESARLRASHGLPARERPL